MKKIALLLSVITFPVFSSTTAVTVPVKGKITSATCSIAADSEVDFGSITALSINNNAVAEKDINMTLNCDWTATNVKLTFEPGAIVTGDDKTMQSGLAGVGFKLPSMGLLSNLSFNTEHTWTRKFNNGGTNNMAVKIKPVKIPSQDIAAGNIDTTLTIRLSYD